MARTEIPLVILDPTDASYVNSAEVTIQTRPSGGSATVWDAETGGSPITQPLSSDAQGRVTGWLDRGRYQAVIEYPDTSTTTVYFDSTPGEDGAITAAWLGTGAVTTTKIGDDAVTQDKIADNAVGDVQLSANSVSSGKIQDGAVTGNKIPTDAVDATKLKDDAVTDSNRSVTADHIRNSAVTTDKIATSAVTNAKIGATAVTSSKIGARAILPSHMGDHPHAKYDFDQVVPDANNTFLAPSAQHYDVTATVITYSEGVILPTTGIYLLTAWVEWEADSDGRRELFFFYNNGDHEKTTLFAPGNTKAHQTNSTTFSYNTSGFTAVGVKVFQNSNNALDVTGSFSISFLGKGP